MHEALGADAGPIFVRPRPNLEVRYADEVIFEALRLAAVLQGDPLSKSAYDEYVAAFGGPSDVLVVKRLETWKNACRAAGLGVISSPGNTNRRWVKDELVEILIDYFSWPGARGSYDDYGRWAVADKAARGPRTVARGAGEARGGQRPGG